MQELTRDGKPTPLLRARVLREELEDRRPRLEDLARDLRGTVGEDAQARADAVNVALGHLESVLNALTIASSAHEVYRR